MPKKHEHRGLHDRAQLELELWSTRPEDVHGSASCTDFHSPRAAHLSASRKTAPFVSPSAQQSLVSIHHSLL
eukprot:6323215-Pyramimonas_sp.AAC.1